MIVREQRSDESAALRALLTAAFDDDGRVADLTAALAARPDSPGPALVAEADGTVAGLVGLSRSWLDADRALVDVLILSPLGVLPSHRRRGVGRALVDAALDRARALDAPALFLEGDPAYYSRLGWRPAVEYGCTAPSPRIPAAAFQVVVLPGWESWMAGPLVYNDTFWAWDCVGLRKASARTETA